MPPQTQNPCPAENLMHRTICPIPTPGNRAHRPGLAALISSFVAVSVLLLGGCANPAGIASHAEPIDVARAGLGGAVVSTPAIAADWWRSFDDLALNALVERALKDSPNLKLVQTRLARAAAAAAGAEAAEGLQINATADVTRQRFSGNSIYPPPLGGSIRTLGTVQAGASWEADTFGRNRAAIEAALGTQRAAEADVQTARTVLASQVARTYVQLGRLFEQREVAERTLAQRSEILGLIRQRVTGGLDTNVELRQGEASLPDARLLIEQLDEQIVLARHALAALTAQPPDALDGLQPSLRGTQALALPQQLPADLLGRRADIAAARWRIEAAQGDMRSARAQFYPNLNLTAFVGLSSIGLDRLIRSGSQQYGAGPALRLPIFDNGRLRANLSGKAAEVDAAIEAYNAAVVDAVHEAADQIAALRSVARQQVQQATAQDAAEQAFSLATQRYRAGLSTYITVLNAESALLSQRRQAVDLRARALDAQIVLVRALGGGYVPEPTSPRIIAKPTPGALS